MPFIDITNLSPRSESSFYPLSPVSPIDESTEAPDEEIAAKMQALMSWVDRASEKLKKEKKEMEKRRIRIIEMNPDLYPNEVLWILAPSIPDQRSYERKLGERSRGIERDDFTPDQLDKYLNFSKELEEIFHLWRNARKAGELYNSFFEERRIAETTRTERLVVTPFIIEVKPKK